MSNFNVDVEGFPELIKKIEELSSDKKKKTEILGILRSVASATVKSAKRNAPVSKRKHVARKKTIEPGNLQKSIGTITGKKGASVVNPTIYVGPRAKGSFDGWYGHMVEAGHKIYRNEKNRGKKSVLARITNKRKGNSVGFVKGVPFMYKSYQETKGQVTSESEQKVAKYIQRRIDRLSR